MFNEQWRRHFPMPDYEIDAAKKKDIKFGRPTLELPENLEIVMQAVEAKQITVSQALGQLHISRSSYYRLKQHQ